CIPAGRVSARPGHNRVFGRLGIPGIEVPIPQIIAQPERNFPSLAARVTDDIAANQSSGWPVAPTCRVQKMNSPAPRPDADPGDGFGKAISPSPASELVDAADIECHASERLWSDGQR